MAFPLSISALLLLYHLCFSGHFRHSEDMVKAQLVLDICNLSLLDSMRYISYQAATQLWSTQLLLT